MQLLIDNFAKAWMTDAELDQDKLYSFLTFINSDVDYERGSSVRRPGYNRHHATSLTGTPKQFYSFTNLAGETRELVIAYDPAATAHYHLFVLSGGAGYEVRNYSTSPTTTLVFDSRDNYPFITVGNRVFFADDNGWYWSNYSSLVKGAGPYTYECYQVGIDKPVNKPAITNGELDSPPASEQQNISTLQAELYDITSPRMFAQSFKPKYYQNLDGVTLRFTKKGTPHGSIRVRVETNSSNNPSGTLVSDTSLSGWDCDITTDITATLVDVPNTIHFMLEALIDQLVKDTTYWYVIEVTQEYVATEDVDNHIAISGNANDAYTRGEAKYWNGSAWATLGALKDVYFYAGLTPSWEWGPYVAPFNNENHLYKIAFQNSTYVVESMLSPSEQSYVATAGYKTGKIAIPSTNDEQVDTVTIYRTHGAASTADIVETYYYVGKVPVTESYFLDVAIDDLAVSECQTDGIRADKHLRLADADDNLIVPYLLEIWNGRIWAVKFHDNVLNYSKMLEEAGATGVAGDSIYDYFPADNKWTLDSEIRSIRKRGEDEFEAYTSNNNVHVFRGGSDALNPPPDLTQQEMVIGANCFDDRTLQEHKGRHIFLTSDKEIKAFNGTVDLEELGDAITSFLLQNGTKFSSCIYKSQYCLGCDADSDNVMDSVIIFDLSQPRITNWRRYQYLNSYGATGDLMKFYNLFVTRDARMFVCPADLDTNAFYVVQLMTGYTDDWTTDYSDGVDITRIIQTQFIIPARRARWTRVELSCFYPHGMYYGTDFYGGGMYGGAETVPTYVIYAIGKSDEFCQTTIAPKSSRDISGHVAGIRLLSEECSVRIEDTGDKPDEIRSLELHWSFN